MMAHKRAETCSIAEKAIHIIMFDGNAKYNPNATT
jgi:hypothetical protein